MKNKKLLVLGLILAAAGTACSSSDNGDGGDVTGPDGDAVEISVVDNAFEPAQVGASVGDTVVWTWGETAEPHNVVADEGEFSSGSATAEPGTTFEHTFEEAGTFSYTCQVHPTEMTGTVTVA